MNVPRPAATLRCHHCGDVLGAYEPIVALVGGRPHDARRAAIQDGELDAGECYHEACFANARPNPRAT